MRTLFIAPQVPWPPDVGSRIRVFHLLRSYSQLGPVTLVCLAQTPEEARWAEALPEVEELRGNVQRIHCFSVASDSGSRGGKLAALVQIARQMPRVVREFRSPELAARVEELLDGERFDTVHVERIFMAANVTKRAWSRAASSGVLRILDIDDLESAKLRRALDVLPASSTRRLALVADSLKLRRYESRILSTFDVSLVCSQQDCRTVHALQPSRTAWVFSNGADVTVSAPGIAEESHTLAYLGAMSYQPNEDAVLFFATTILPLIKRRVPDARFIVAGGSPSAKVMSLHDGRNVVVRGYVDDKQALFAACTVFVVPIRIGGGTRIKILEAMAAGKPVVSTSIGCEGIEAAPGREILIGDSPDAFADACVQLLGNAERRAAIGRAGQMLVNHHYRWDAIRDEFVSRLRGRHANGA